MRRYNYFAIALCCVILKLNAIDVAKCKLAEENILTDTILQSVPVSKSHILINGDEDVFRNNSYDIDLTTDTINVGGLFKVLITLPTASVDNSFVDPYEEGFFKIYPLNGQSFIMLHSGSLQFDADMKKGLRYKTDSLIYECKMGNLAWSRSFKRNNLIYRYDNYPTNGVYIAYKNVTNDELELANKILNEIEFINIPK